MRHAIWAKGVITMTGATGRWRAIRRAPVWVTQQIAGSSSVSATSRAAAAPGDASRSARAESLAPTRPLCSVRGMRPETPSKIFVSYSRQDRDFAADLIAGLQHNPIFEVIYDKNRLKSGDDWKARLSLLIRQCDTMVFIISPASISSEMCAWEVDEAVRYSRRVQPVLWKDVSFQGVPAALAARQAVDFSNDRVIRGLADLVSALNEDLDWLHAHTTLSERAEDWVSNQRLSSNLLRGTALAEARDLLARRPADAPEPSATVEDYVAASVAEETREIETQRSQIAALETANAAAKHAEKRIRSWLFASLAAFVSAFIATGIAVRFYDRAQDNLRVAHDAINEFAEAAGGRIEYIEEILSTISDFAEQDPGNAEFLQTKFALHERLAAAWRDSREAPERAIQEYWNALDTLDRLDALGAPPRGERHLILVEIANLEASLENFSAAGARYRNAIALLKRHAPQTLEIRLLTSDAMRRLGGTHVELGESAAALRALVLSYEIASSASAENRKSIAVRKQLYSSIWALVDHHENQKQIEVAIRYTKQIFEDTAQTPPFRDEELGEIEFNQIIPRERRKAIERLGDLHMKAGSPADAENMHAQLLDFALLELNQCWRTSCVQAAQLPLKIAETYLSNREYKKAVDVAERVEQ
ncbi:MAG: toll/interleukin-1 receptor domain-containing protein, partial [Pseudomonadota bacterium]